MTTAAEYAPNARGLVDLGHCRHGNCRGDLFTRDGEVHCHECGRVQDYHPVTIQAREFKKRQLDPADEPAFRPAQFEATYSSAERILKLERDSADLRKQVAKLSGQVADLKKQVAESTGGQLRR